MGSKTVSDCVESVIGAYYVSGGLIAALHVMKWFGINAELDHSLISEAITSASLRYYIPKEDEVKGLESKLGYVFSVKFLLQEAMTHASVQEQGVTYCYQVIKVSSTCSFLSFPPLFRVNYNNQIILQMSPKGLTNTPPCLRNHYRIPFCT